MFEPKKRFPRPKDIDRPAVLVKNDFSPRPPGKAADGFQAGAGSNPGGLP
jgi:hypothetical protein